MNVDHRALIERLADIMSQNDWDALSALFTSDAVLEFPQSGEVFRGVRTSAGSTKITGPAWRRAGSLLARPKSRPARVAPSGPYFMPVPACPDRVGMAF